MAPTFRGMAVSVKSALARLIASARLPKRKLRGDREAGSDEAKPEPVTALGKREDEDAGADAIVVRAADATTVANEAEIGVGGAEPATAKPRRPLLARKGAIGIVLLTGVAAAAIMVLKWPHASHPQAVVEPGMLADQPTKVMAPSAALAMVPPREEANVAGERPQVRADSGRRGPGGPVVQRGQGDRIPAGGSGPNPFSGRRICHFCETGRPNGRPATAAPPSRRPARRVRSGRETDESRVGPDARSRSGSRSLFRRSPVSLARKLRSLVLARRRRSSRALASSRRR